MKPEFLLKIDYQTDVFFGHRLEVAGIEHNRREIPGGGYDIPLIDYQFFDKEGFEKANEILNEFYEPPEEIIQIPKWKKIIFISFEMVSLICLIGLNIWFIQFAILETESPEIWIAVIICLGLSSIPFIGAYNNYKPKRKK